ncbi:hypothetical protein J4E90_011002 [Alternaria incomplexa]|uniref:uncharacterized protein n=1 Tax=Alternaria incomplexa TaxID=1187928 RepID=UPI0022202B2D|nr:uncharacterized protein J4E90_011002 [Alternaria incomplexa]KAI4906004.1 hypothetical protein J4E90_011002 [Alternaria incomplexa]
MSSSSSQSTMPASVPLQRVGDTVAHGTVGLATKADLDAVKASIDQLKTEQQEINLRVRRARRIGQFVITTLSLLSNSSKTSYQPVYTASFAEPTAQATNESSPPNVSTSSARPAEQSAPTLNEETVSAQAAAQAEEGALSDEELRELRPLRQQSTRLLCINEDFRFKTLVGLYCALKSRNPAQTSSRTRLPESQLINMARYAEFDILRGIDRKVIRRQLASVPSLILNEYSTGRQEMWSSFNDMLMDADLAILKEPMSVKPYDIKLANNLRSGTLVEFYDKLVEANTLVSHLKHDEALQHALIEVYQSMGTAPFWNDFIPLDSEELVRLAKQIEDDVFSRLLMDVRGGKLDVSHENAYIRLTARYRPGTDAMGLRNFAAMASKFLDQMET